MTRCCLKFIDKDCINIMNVYKYKNNVYKYESLSKEQKYVFDKITKTNVMFFVNAGGGCGKSFCAITIANYFSINKTIFTSSTGVASIQFPNGKQHIQSLGFQLLLANKNFIWIDFWKRKKK